MINFKEKDNIILAYKPIGKTPLEIINELKQNYGYSKAKMSYAGRLDPMAHGLMIILKDAECYKQHLYHNFSKIYKFKLLLGISTDTFDILGKITNNSNTNSNINTDNLYSIINSLIGKQKQHYPPYSSARVDGHPLWYYAKNNLLHTITIPYKEIEVSTVKIIDDETIDYINLKNIVNNNISKLDKKNNFRQEEILKEWNNIFNINYRIITIETEVSCGTYIRSLCNLIGEQLKIPALALDIYRTKVGDYNL
jgi:tRNA pseudouridine55 synthase